MVISISPDTYIDYNGTKFYLLNAIGIDHSPKKTIYNDIDDHDYNFTLILSPIPHNAFQFDLIEPGTSSWKFYNIN